MLTMKSHESSYTEELRSVISTAHPLQQSKAVAASNGGLTMEREVREEMWKLPRGIVDRKKFTYMFYYCKGETFFYYGGFVEIYFYLDNPENQLSVYECSHMILRWWCFCSGLLRLLRCCGEAGFPKQRLSPAWTAWKLSDLPKLSLLNAGTAVKSLQTRL